MRIAKIYTKKIHNRVCNTSGWNLSYEKTITILHELQKHDVLCKNIGSLPISVKCVVISNETIDILDIIYLVTTIQQLSNMVIVV